MTDDLILDQIEELIADFGPKWLTIGEIINDNPEKLRSKWRRSGRKDPTQKDEIETQVELNNLSGVLFEDKVVTEKVGWRDILSHAIDANALNKKLEYKQREATVRIETDEPIIIVYTADWQLGDGATDHALWYQDIRKIMDTPNVYMIDLGDSYQNMRSFRVLSAVLSQVLSPSQQATLLKGLVDELSEKGKLLAKIGGNHDEEFDERVFGQALQQYLYAKSQAPLFPNRGVLHLKIGKEKYDNLLFHKSRFKSFIRPAHGAFREWQMSYPAEVVAGAHDHQPALEIFWAYAQLPDDATGKEVFLLKTGTYQDSEFGWRYWGQGAIPVMPVVVYFPHEHKKVPFMNLDDAIKFTQGAYDVP
jgi:hypothetical protein